MDTNVTTASSSSSSSHRVRYTKCTFVRISTLNQHVATSCKYVRIFMEAHEKCAPYISIHSVNLAESFGISKEVVATSILVDFRISTSLGLFFSLLPLKFNARKWLPARALCSKCKVGENKMAHWFRSLNLDSVGAESSDSLFDYVFGLFRVIFISAIFPGPLCMHARLYTEMINRFTNRIWQAHGISNATFSPSTEHFIKLEYDAYHMKVLGFCSLCCASGIKHWNWTWSHGFRIRICRMMKYK